MSLPHTSIAIISLVLIELPVGSQWRVGGQQSW